MTQAQNLKQVAIGWRSFARSCISCRHFDPGKGTRGGCTRHSIWTTPGACCSEWFYKHNTIPPPTVKWNPKGICGEAEEVKVQLG